MRGRAYGAVIVLLLFGSAASAEEPKQICRTVYDDTVSYLVGCYTPAPEHYLCPADGGPCESLSTLAAPSGCSMRATKQVCGPPEIFTDEPPK